LRRKKLGLLPVIAHLLQLFQRLAQGCFGLFRLCARTFVADWTQITNGQIANRLCNAWVTWANSA
jgi:hypothetical protein